jgi:hypothetical protein
MKLEYALTLDDYKAAQRLHRSRTAARRIKFAISYSIFPALTVVGLISIFLLKSSDNAELKADLLICDFALFFLSVAMPIARIFDMRIRFKRLQRTLRGVSSVFLEIGEECIISAIPGVSEGKFFWNASIDFAQDDKVSLLYVRKRAFFFFPTSVMSPDQRTELNDLVARHVAKKKS